MAAAEAVAQSGARSEVYDGRGVVVSGVAWRDPVRG